MQAKLSGRLIWKLLGSYVLVILVGALVWGIAVELVVPTVFNRHIGAMTSIMGMSNDMMEGSDLFINFREALNEVLLWGAGTSTLVALIIAWLLSRQLAAPVLDMTRVSQSIADGHFDERVAAPDRPDQADELGQLAFSFNRMAEQLQQIEEMRSQLMGDVSHELRTPLTLIKGSMEGLIDGVLPANAESFQDVHREATRLQRLVDDLQELSRTEAGAYPIRPEPLSVGELFQVVSQHFAPQFDGKDVSFEVGFVESEITVFADRDRSIQVLTNLIGNALQNTPAGGYVTLSAILCDAKVEFVIRDSGVGIAPEHLSPIFHRFFRADKSRARASGGSGIGLTIAKHLVEAQGGQIWAESAGLGQGATFHFTLPRQS